MAGRATLTMVTSSWTTTKPKLSAVTIQPTPAAGRSAFAAAAMREESEAMRQD